MSQDTATIDNKYQLFVERAAATKMVWGLMGKGGWANTHAGDDEEVTLIPFWSDRALAKACARDDWKSFTPTSIPLGEFLETWCTGMAEEGNVAGVNLDTHMHGTETEAYAIALDVLEQIKSINSTVSLKNYPGVDELIADLNQITDQEEE
ncbi:DUF2750 domain-containing protein [Mucilaginibacter myungsuensis]|uniref:DUF2750 domain-containing protein n=1 Tax=Mucilaginibacter myungsuensis TaxID=649104 RepID=A0A929L0C1_9SPHI|nr:DUF2750 domain-containing protein [Mucilaginibacter myungsuensis]MBE9664497.1 DUF2750 domain-containing protein [Mucilaginibacter myungsuensis]MDN3601358.1 DUF2750 domain-containing protein [Mucilaginibacter myungsuensis]